MTQAARGREGACRLTREGDHRRSLERNARQTDEWAGTLAKRRAIRIAGSTAAARLLGMAVSQVLHRQQVQHTPSGIFFVVTPHVVLSSTRAMDYPASA